MGTHTILIVDDDSCAREALARILYEGPFELIAAASAAEALDLLERNTVDVVLSDHEMPGMCGTKFLTKVSALYPDTVRFMLTGHATLDVAIDAINNGAISRFFVKPCNPTDLLASLRDALLQRDLVVEMKQLLVRTKRQDAVLHDLEIAHPGITQLDTDSAGAIIIEDCPASTEELIEESRRICR